MDSSIAPGSKRSIGGRLRVYYNGYWIKAYAVPADTLEQKKQLIEALTRRLFNHVEHGLNVPGRRLGEARRAYEQEQEQQRKRVKGAMLAGALFNRATDIFKKVVELQEAGVVIEPDNPLLCQCGAHLEEAFTLGKLVLHRNGDEGIDELWGEPLKAFSFPLEHFYQSRYIKIALTMEAIDRICEGLSSTLTGCIMFAGVDTLLRRFGEAAKIKCETLRTDPDIFDVWSDFVFASEALACFEPEPPARSDPTLEHLASEGMALLRAGKELVADIARARVPMPKSTRELLERCDRFKDAYCIPTGPSDTSWCDRELREQYAKAHH